MTTPNNFNTSNSTFASPNAVETPTERPAIGKMKDAVGVMSKSLEEEQFNSQKADIAKKLLQGVRQRFTTCFQKL